MKYFRLVASNGDSVLAVETADGVLSDLTSLDGELTEIEDLALASYLSGVDMDTLTSRLLEQWSEATTYDLQRIFEDSRSGDGDLILDRPFEPPEVWAVGVTYKVSELERRGQSDTPDIYVNAHTAARPALFLKATVDRCVGPFESIGIRSDSGWNVPEPELSFVLYKDEIIGYTIGNDVTSRSLEAENPLYLTQAKLYDRCCSIGPCFVSAGSLADPQDLRIRCTVTRNGEEAFIGESSSSLMARGCDELAGWLGRNNLVPNMTAVLTGAAVVPPREFTLQEGDAVAIYVEGIGTLENQVVVV